MSGPARERTLSHEQVRRVYDRIGRLLDTQGFYENEALDLLVRHGRFEQAHAVFELGCGTGRFAERLLAGPLPKDARYTAIDLSPAMVRIARERLARFGERVQVQATDGTLPTPWPDGAFDRFLTTYVLDLLPEGEIDAALAEAARLLVPGGLLCAASLSSGTGPLSRGVCAAWRALHRVAPALLGGCRPVDLAPRLDPARWRVQLDTRVTPFGVPSEVLVAERLA